MSRRILKRREDATAVVEFAILLPVLVMLVFGIIEFGRYYNATITLTHAAREAVRRVALNTGSAVTAGQAAASPLMVTVTTGGACANGADATATVSYVFSYDIPLVKSGSSTISRTAVMKCGG